MSDGMGREFTYLSSHATNRYFIQNWGRCLKIISSKSVQSDYLRIQRISLIRLIRCLKIISSKSV